MNHFRRRDGFLHALQESAVGQAHSALARDGQVIVVALCAERALVSLRLNPALYQAYDAGPVNEDDPLNLAHYFRVRPKLPSAKQ